MKKIKVLKVEYGKLDYRRILKGNYPELQKEFFEKNGFNLPEYEDLDQSKVDQLRVFMSDAEIKVKTSEGVIKCFIFAGFLTDLASVPSLLRSAVDNDAQWIIVGAIFHDACFGGNLLSFELSNSIFKQICRLEGANFWQRTVVWWAVSTDIGRKKYEEGEFESMEIKSLKVCLAWMAK